MLGMALLVGMTVLWLVFLEGLLSADNALVLAMLVRHLPNNEHQRALRDGSWREVAFRLVAGYFIILLERFRGLESGAYALVAWIGLNLVVDGVHDGKLIPFEMNEWVFWLGMLAIAIVSFLYKPKPSRGPATADEAEEAAV